jgi:hypothetical protein
LELDGGVLGAARLALATIGGRPGGLPLGVTPELYHLGWPSNTDLLALDRACVMIEEVWPGPANARWKEIGCRCRCPCTRASSRSALPVLVRLGFRDAHRFSRDIQHRTNRNGNRKRKPCPGRAARAWSRYEARRYPPCRYRSARAPSRRRAAAEQLLNLMEMEKMMSQSVDQMLAMQMKQSPGMAQYEPQMRAFLSKYMSWGTVKEDMVKIYMAEFTEPEIKELIKFYQTDVGKKTVQKMPTLLAKSAELSQKRMQEHMPELQQAIQGSAAAQSPAAPAASAAATASPAKKGP